MRRVCKKCGGVPALVKTDSAATWKRECQKCGSPGPFVPADKP